MGNTPAFQYYPADLLSDPEVMFWDMEQVGCYWQMITYLWLNEGKFEYKVENLCKLFRKNHKKTSEKLWKSIEKKFIIKNGIVTHKRVSKMIKEQSSKRIARQEAGRKGGIAKASNATILPVAKSSTSSSVSSSTPLKEKKIIKKKKYGKHKNVLLTDPELKKLQDRFNSGTNYRIENMSDGLALKGYVYKSHYLAILKWAEKEDHQPGKTQKWQLKKDR